MPIRYVSWRVQEDTHITPATPQYGGVQGEHNATQIAFVLTQDSPLTNPNYRYYIECVDATGGYDRSKSLSPNGVAIEMLLPLAWTQYGGISTIRLVIEEEGTTIFTVEGRLQFEDRHTAAEKVDGMLRSDLSDTLAQCQQAATDAAASAEETAATGAAMAAACEKSAREAAATAAALQRYAPDWRQKDPAGVGYIRHRPIIETPADNSYGLQIADPWEPNNVDGTFSTALGSANRIAAGANYSLASGFDNAIAAQGKQTALGLRNVLQGDTDTAIGRYNTVAGLASAAIGERNHAAGDTAIAIGHGLTAACDRQVVLGRYNAPNPTAVLIVGNGGARRQNAMTVQADGTLTLGGHAEADTLYPALRSTDRLSAMADGTAIGICGDVTVSGGLTYDGRKTAQFINNTDPRLWYSAQANLDGCYVRAGDPYTLTMHVYSAYSNAVEEMGYWLAVMPQGTEEHIFTDSSDFWENHAVGGYEYAHWQTFPNDRFTTVSLTFTPERSGLLRLGIGAESGTGNKYYIGGITLHNNAPSHPMYRYASVTGDHHETLYRIGDMPCDAAHIGEWLLGRTLTTEYGDIPITADMISHDREGWHDACKSCIVTYAPTADANPIILLCAVDSIAPREMDVGALGLYASVRVYGLPTERWVDEPLTA